METTFLNENNVLICSNANYLRIMNIKTRKENLLLGNDDLVTTCDVYK